MKVFVILLCIALSSNSVVCSTHIRKRSDDTEPVEAVVMKLSADFDRLQTQQTAMETRLSDLQAQLEVEKRHAAFFAQFSTGEVTTPSSGPFRFDHVLFNDGNHYDPSLGIFTAPYQGVYVFSAKFFEDGAQTTHTVLDIMVNGHTQDRMSFAQPNVEAGRKQSSQSTSMTLKLQSGDKVWVTTYQGRVYRFYGIYHSFFSGALLYSD